MDRLRCIEVFSEVARSLSFSAAALRLGMAKGNVSKHVAALEDMLGAQLLSRTTKSVNLTEAGLALLESGQDLLDRFDLIQEAAGGGVMAARGTIRIGTPPSFGAQQLVPLVTAFSTLHQAIQFAVHLDDGKLDLISEGLDLSLRIAPWLKDTSLVAKKLGSAPQVLVASPAYLAAHGRPLLASDLLSHDCLVNALKAPTNFWNLSNAQGKTSVRVRGSLRSDFGEALRHAALLGHGISMHPIYMVEQDIAAQRLEVVLQDYTPTGLDIYAVYPSRRNMPGRVRLFLEFLQHHYASTANGSASAH